MYTATISLPLGSSCDGTYVDCCAPTQPAESERSSTPLVIGFTRHSAEVDSSTALRCNRRTVGRPSNQVARIRAHITSRSASGQNERFLTMRQRKPSRRPGHSHGDEHQKQDAGAKRNPNGGAENTGGERFEDGAPKRHALQ